MMIFFKIIRPINLLIAVIGGLLFRWISVGAMGELLPLTAYMLGVVFIMSAGYLINDYFDFKTDSVNKPNKSRFTNRNNYLLLFFILNGTALLLSLYCANFNGFFSVPFVYTLAIALLWMYSYIFQVLPLIGNLTIAFLVVLLYIPLKDGYESTFITNAFMGLSFMITLARELIKDLEDKKGDKLVGYKTLPILVGDHISRILASLFIVIAMNMLYSSLWSNVSQYWALLSMFFIIQLSLFMSGVFMFVGFDYKISNKGFKRASLQLKISMFLFMLLIFMMTF